MRNIIDSVMPTTAIASAPICATKKISTIANNLSANISTIIGTANRKIAVPKGAVVKSRFDPAIDSLKIENTDSLDTSVSLPFVDIKNKVRFRFVKNHFALRDA